MLLKLNFFIFILNHNLEINNALKELYGKDLQFKKVSDDIPDWKQLLIMTSSKHYIIGNSTFSWFGAYLSSSINPVICYPNEWLGEKYKGTITDDLFPDSWNRICVDAVNSTGSEEVSEKINNIRIS